MPTGLAYPFLADVLNAHPSNYLTAQTGLTGLADNIEFHAAAMATDITSLPWQGQTHNAAVGRAAEEKAAIGRIVTVARQTATTIGAQVPTLQHLQSAIILDVIALFVDSYAVGQDWTVRDAKAYPDGDAAQQSANNAEKRRRGQFASDATRRLLTTAEEFGNADLTLHNAIRSAIQGINALSPAGGAVSIKAAGKLLDDLHNHRQLSPTELAELRESTGLTPDQLEAIRRGRPVNIPANKYAYVRDIMGGLEDMSPSDIDQIGDYLDPHSRDAVKAGIANGLQFMGNPLISDGLGHHGGMAALPNKVRETLQRDPVTFDTSNPTSGIYWKLTNYHDLVALKDLLGKGDSALRVNTDIDRGLFKQASELASINSNRAGLHNVSIIDETGHIVQPDDLSSTINGMVSIADADHPAITDFLTGTHMDVTVEPGGHFNANDSFLNLVTYPFGHDQHAVAHMFDWIGPNATTPGHEGDLAAIAANAYSHHLSDNATLLGLDTNGSDANGDHPTLGSINPELTQALTRNIIPYLGALNGVEGTGVHTFPGFGFGDISQMEGMIQVLDSDPVSAAAINHAGAAWENYMTSMYAAHGGDPSFAAAAGRFHQMFQDADSAELQGLFSQHNWDRIKEYNLNSTEWDTAKTMVTTGLKFLPGPFGTAGSILGSVIDVANPDVKLSALGIANDPSTIPADHISDAIKGAFNNYNTETQGLYHQRDLALGYASTHGGLEADPRWAPFLSPNPSDPDGPRVLDWSKIIGLRREFNDAVDGLPVPKDGWNNAGDGYPSGARPGANIDPHQLPAPGDDPTRRPR